MFVEERVDALPRVDRRGAVVGEAADPREQARDPARVVVQEGMAGVGVLLDVVRDAGLGEALLELGGGAAEAEVLLAVARDNRAGALELLAEVARQDAVVDRRGGEVEARRTEQREAAAQ